VAVTSRPSDFRTLFPLYGRRSGVRLALGLHPLEVSKVDVDRELKLFRSYASHTSYIGEIGLDLSAHGRETRTEQFNAFEAILATKGVPEKVMSLHSRGAAREVVAAIAEAGATRAVMHWFSGALRDLDAGLQAGCFFSINPSMTQSAKGKRIIAAIPRERMLVETDGPYVRAEGRVLEPRDVWGVIDYLAREWQMPRGGAAELLEANLAQLVAGL
jgi:TatD DNase family protein